MNNKVNRNSAPVNKNVAKNKQKTKKRKETFESECNGVSEDGGPKQHPASLGATVPGKNSSGSKAHHSLSSSSSSSKTNPPSSKIEKHLANGSLHDKVAPGSMANAIASSPRNTSGGNNKRAPSSPSDSQNLQSIRHNSSGDDITSITDTSSRSIGGGSSSGDDSSSNNPGLPTRLGSSGTGSHDCSYCNLQFSSQAELQVHCRSQEHQTTIMSDTGHSWLHRPPPRGLAAAEYRLCQSVGQGSWSVKCRLGEQCICAHSEAELAEWRERFDYRAMKLQQAKDKHLHGASYADQLLDRLSSAQHQHEVITDKVSPDNISSSLTKKVLPATDDKNIFSNNLPIFNYSI